MRFIRLPEVKQKTGLSRSSIYEYINQGRFPKNLKMGSRASAWVESEVEDWINHRSTSRFHATQSETSTLAQELLLKVFS